MSLSFQWSTGDYAQGYMCRANSRLIVPEMGIVVGDTRLTPRVLTAEGDLSSLEDATPAGEHASLAVPAQTLEALSAGGYFKRRPRPPRAAHAQRALGTVGIGVPVVGLACEGEQQGVVIALGKKGAMIMTRAYELAYVTAPAQISQPTRADFQVMSKVVSALVQSGHLACA